MNHWFVVYCIEFNDILARDTLSCYNCCRVLRKISGPDAKSDALAIASVLDNALKQLLNETVPYAEV